MSFMVEGYKLKTTPSIIATSKRFYTRLTWKLDEDLTMPVLPVWHLPGPRQSSVGFSGLATTPDPCLSSITAEAVSSSASTAIS